VAVDGLDYSVEADAISIWLRVRLARTTPGVATETHGTADESRFRINPSCRHLPACTHESTAVLPWRNGVSQRNEDEAARAAWNLKEPLDNKMTPGRLEVYCCVATVAAGLWGFFYPRPYALCIAVLISLPWLSILAGRLIRTGDALAYTALSPIIAIGMRACFDLEFSTLGRLAALSFSIGALFVALVFLADRSAWRRYGLALVLGPLFYGFGAAGEVDVLLDASVTKFSAVPILSRNYGMSRNSTFDLVLAPWGDRDRSNKNFVSWYTYLALRGESTACIDSGPGALGVAWYRIAACGHRPQIAPN
jgi:hypothetical protein